MRWWEQTGIDWKAAREKAAAEDGDEEAEVSEPDLTVSDSERETATPGGTSRGTGEEASLGASGTTASSSSFAAAFSLSAFQPIPVCSHHLL